MHTGEYINNLSRPETTHSIENEKFWVLSMIKIPPVSKRHQCVTAVAEKSSIIILFHRFTLFESKWKVMNIC